jgi:hypothetical protein
VVKGQATNEVLGQTGRALYTRVTNVLTTWPLSGQHTQVNIGEGWTKAHGFFIIMGGFHAFQRDDPEKPDGSLNPGTPFYPLDDMMVRVAARKGLIELPLKEEIQDKSKTDWLAKILVLFQTGWFVVQCLARGVVHLPLSELEVITLAYAIMNVGIYIAWWDKPRNVEWPIRVFISSDITAYIDNLLVMKTCRIPGRHLPFSGSNCGQCPRRE